MEAEFHAYLVGLTALVLAFSVWLAFSMRQLGYSFHDYLDRDISCGERLKTPLGRRAAIPRLFLHGRSALRHLVRNYILAGGNGALLGAVFWNHWHQYLAFTPIVVLVLAAEWYVIWRLQQSRRVRYEEEFQQFMKNTAPENRAEWAWLMRFDPFGTASENAAIRQFPAGRLIWACLNHPAGTQQPCLRLYCPEGIEIPSDAFAPSLWMHHETGQTLVFYEPKRSIGGMMLDGIVVGYQLSACAKVPCSTMAGYEERRGKREARAGAGVAAH